MNIHRMLVNIVVTIYPFIYQPLVYLTETHIVCKDRVSNKQMLKEYT